MDNPLMGISFEDFSDMLLEAFTRNIRLQNEFINALFGEFNRELFSNELQDITLEILDNSEMIDITLDSDGYYEDPELSEEDLEEVYYLGYFDGDTRHIYINRGLFGNGDVNELLLVAETLLHEMVHGYLFQQGHGADYKHGELFQREAIRRGLVDNHITEPATTVFYKWWFTTRGQE